jgi:hypothetical protein
MGTVGRSGSTVGGATSQINQEIEEIARQLEELNEEKENREEKGAAIRSRAKFAVQFAVALRCCLGREF